MAAALAAIVAFPQWQFMLDTTFRTQILQQNVISIALQPDGLLLSGTMRFPGDMSNRLLTKVDLAGNQVLSFPFGYGGGKITPWEGKYYVSVGQTIRRVLATGYVDPTFIELNLGPYFQSSQGGDYHVFPDGRVLISGQHNLSDSTRGFVGQYDLIWFSNEGYLDTTRIHRQSNGFMWDFTALPDGKFLCSCSCTMYEGQPVDRVFRIHADGALDTTFQSGINWGNIYAYHPLPDGRVYVGGRFKRAEVPNDTLYIVRLMPDGSLDPSFNNHNSLSTSDGITAYPKVTNIVPWYDGSIFAMGVMRHVNGQTRGGICVLDNTGQLTPLLENSLPGTFSYQTSTNASIHGIVPAPDSSAYYIWGTYTGYNDGTINDTLQRFVSRLLVEELNVALQEEENARSFSIQPNPTNGSVTFTFDPAMGRSNSITIRDIHGRKVTALPIREGTDRVEWNAAELAPGIYFVSFKSGGSVSTQKLVVN